MGQDSSAPILSSKKKNLRLSDQKIIIFPFFIPKDHEIKSIEISKNQIKSFPNELNNLEILDLSENDLETVFSSNFDILFEFPSLKTLKLSNNSLQNIPKFIKNFKSLKNLSLDRNYLSNLDLYETEIEVLDLFINCLNEVPKLPETIKGLNLGFNQIHSFDSNLPNLIELRLSGNLITTISSNINLKNLTMLDLSHNHIFELPNISDICPKLEFLQLTFNFLCKFPKGIPISIIKLDVSYNCIEIFEEPIDHLINLTNFDISHNLLKELPLLPPNIKSIYTEYNKFENIIPIIQNTFKIISFIESNLIEIPDISKSKIKTLILKRNKILNLNYQERINKSLNTIELTSNY